MSLSTEISEWQAVDVSDEILDVPGPFGGDDTWSGSVSSGGGTTTPGRTYIAVGKPFTSAGTVSTIKFNCKDYYSTGWKFKVFRWDAENSHYDMVAEQAISIPAEGTVTIELSPSISVESGDIPGLFLPYYVAGGPDNVIGVTSGDANDTKYVTGDITTNDAFSSGFAYDMDLACYSGVSGTPVRGAGLPLASWTHTNSFSGGTSPPGRTIIMPALAFRQAGNVAGIHFWCSAFDAANVADWKFKVFRWNGTNYSYVGESGFDDVDAVGVQARLLDTEITVQVGDIPGIFVPYKSSTNYNEIGAQAKSGVPATRYTPGDITAANAFSSTSAHYACLTAFMKGRPFVAMTGDSIVEGHNNGGSASANSWHTDYHDTTVVNTLPGGTLTSEILYEVAQLQAMNFQNHGMGSQTYAWVASTGAVAALAAQPNALIVLCGVNDVNTSRAWDDVEDNLDTIYGLFQASDTEKLIICEILPWTNGTSGQADTIRTWNGNIATWASGKTGVSVISTYDEMKDPDSEDDMLATYDFDGVHLTTDGVAFLADLIYDALLILYAESGGSLIGCKLMRGGLLLHGVLGR